MSSTLARPMLRQSKAMSRMAARRFESTASSKATEAAKDSASKAKDAAAKAQAAASEYSAKASQGLSKVASSAGPALAGAAKAAQGMAANLSKAGGRTGQTVAFIEKHIPTVLYYSKVGAEVAKIVFRGQQMSPPSVATMQSYYQNAFKLLQNPSQLMSAASKTAQQSASFFQQARSLNRTQIALGGVVFAECLGFFTVGEMIGRFKIVGYHGEGPAAHH